MPGIDWYVDTAADMIDRDEARDKKFKAMDSMFHNDWSLPDSLSGYQWMRSVVSTDPSDALRTAARTLSTVLPKITFFPLDSHPETRARANKIEKALMWHFKRASKRSVSRLVYDIVLSALRYDEIGFQVVYMPWQKKIAKEIESTKQWNTKGDFAWLVHNPRNVHTNRSALDLESVLLCKVMRAESFVSEWGKAASKVQRMIKDDGLQHVVVYDWTDAKERCVWVVPGEVPTSTRKEDTITIYHDEHKLPFIPWVSRVGGSAIDDEPEYQRAPLLDSVYYSHQWDTLNTLKSLEMSIAIATAAAPASRSETFSGESPEIDYTVPGGDVPQKPGEKYEPLPRPQLDARFRELVSKTQAEVGKSTVPAILQSPDTTSGVAFATINTVLKAASSVLDPIKELTEGALSDGFEQCLLWKIHTKDNLFGWDDTKYRQEQVNPLYGSQIQVKSTELDPENLYLDVKLTANLPIDEIQRLNAAQIMLQMGIPRERVYEQLDIPDGDMVIEEKMMEAMTEAAFQNRLKVISAQGDAEAQRILQAVQMEAQQAQMEQQAQAEQTQMLQAQGQISAEQQTQQAMARAAANLPPGEQNAVMAGANAMTQGPGFNPAMGGTPPAMAAPGVTREAVQGRDMTGTPI